MLLIRLIEDTFINGFLCSMHLFTTFGSECTPNCCPSCEDGLCFIEIKNNPNKSALAGKSFKVNKIVRDSN